MAQNTGRITRKQPSGSYGICSFASRFQRLNEKQCQQTAARGGTGKETVQNRRWFANTACSFASRFADRIKNSANKQQPRAQLVKKQCKIGDGLQIRQVLLQAASKIKLKTTQGNTNSGATGKETVQDRRWFANTASAGNSGRLPRG